MHACGPSGAVFWSLPAGTGFELVSQAALYNGRLWVNGGNSDSSNVQIGGVDFGVLPFYSFQMDGQATSLWQPDWIRCWQLVSAAVSAAAVSARPDLGAICANFWHTVATYLSPIFWALLDNEKLFFSLDRVR